MARPSELVNPRFSCTTRLARRVLKSHRGQALVETALVVPLVFLILSGVADLGRAFYFKVATTNAAREAAHWATLSQNQDFAETPADSIVPDDQDVIAAVSEPSQESFGLTRALAPFSSDGLSTTDAACTAAGGTLIRHATAPIGPNFVQSPLVNTPLAAGSSWLFINPSDSSSGRTALSHLGRGPVAWRVASTSSRLVWARAPSDGGLSALAQALGGSLYPRDAMAASATDCFQFNFSSLTPGDQTVTSPIGGGPVSLAAETAN